MTAFVAHADYAEEVLGNFEVVPGRHFILEGLELGRVELDNLAALRTDHVIVMLMFVIVFVVGASIAEAHLARKSGVGENFERAIDGSLADRGIFFLDQLIQIFVGEMLFGAQEDVEDEFALGGTLETFLLDVFKKNFLLFGHLVGHKLACLSVVFAHNTNISCTRERRNGLPDYLSSNTITDFGGVVSVICALEL